MKASDIKIVETDVNPFSKVARLPVVRKNGEVGYVRVSSRGGKNDTDGKQPADFDKMADAEQRRRSNSY